MADGESIFAGIGDVPLFPDANYIAIIAATRRIIHALREVEAAHQTTVEEQQLLVRAPTDISEHAEYVALCESGAYLDASSGLAACGLLAPLIEGMFVHGARYLRDRSASMGLNSGSRRSRASDDEYWNPTRFVPARGKVRTHAAKGILQFAHAVDVGRWQCFPQSLFRLVPPLFALRNQFLHQGYEWSEGDRAKFESTVRARKWENYFDWARIGRDPWMAYMKPTFVDACLVMADDSLKAFARVSGRRGGTARAATT